MGVLETTQAVCDTNQVIIICGWATFCFATTRTTSVKLTTLIAFTGGGADHPSIIGIVRTISYRIVPGWRSFGGARATGNGESISPEAGSAQWHVSQLRYAL